MLFTTLGLTLGNFTVFDFDPPAEAAHLRGSLVTAEYHYHAGSAEVHIQATQLTAKNSPEYFNTPSVSKAANSGANRTSLSGCTFSSRTQTQDTTNPLFEITTSSWTVTNCFTEAAEYTFSSAVCCKISGIQNITNSSSASNQFEIKLVVDSLTSDTAAPTYSSGYMNNILYDAGSVGAEVNYTTNLNALAMGNQPVSSYELVTNQATELGGYGSSRIPCSNLNTQSGEFVINAANCGDGESLSSFQTAGTAKLYALKVRAVDAKGQYATRDVLLAFNTSSNKRPVFTQTSPPPGPLTVVPGGSPVTISVTASDDDSSNTLSFNLSSTRSWITESTITQSVIDGKKVATRTYTLSPPEGTTEILQLQISVFDNDTFSLSSTIQYDIEAGGVLPPGIPAKPNIVLLNGTSVQVNFTAPSSGGAVSSYFVVRTPIGGGAPVETECVNGPGQPCVITGLDSNTAFSFAVKALNSSGSQTSTAATLKTFYPLVAGVGQTFDASDFVLGGDTTVSGSLSTLTPNLTSKKGSLWAKTRADVNKDLVVEARLFLGDGNGLGSGADGLAFVMQPNSSTSLSSGGGLGYADMTPPVFAVEFDTFYNGVHEPTANHIALMKNGNAVVHNAWGAGPVDAGNLEDNKWRNFRFTWRAPSEVAPTEGVIRVEFDLNADGDFTDAGETVFDLAVPLDTYFAASGGNVYWGFTAATGGSANLQQVEVTRFVTQSRVNGAPTVSRANSGSLGVSAGSSVTVPLALSDDSTTSGQWSISAVSSDTSKVTVSTPPTASSATAASMVLSSPGNATDGSVTITVTATDADGTSATASFTVGVGTLPGAPTSVVATPGNSSISIAWTAPAETGGYLVINYVIELSVGTSGTWAAVSRAASAVTTAVVSNLQNGTAYKFRVSAVTDVGQGAASMETTSVSPSAPAAGGSPAAQPVPPVVGGPTPTRPRVPSTGVQPPNAVGTPATQVPEPASSPGQPASIEMAPRPLFMQRVEPTPGVVYTPSNPIPQVLLELLAAPLSYVNEVLNGLTTLPALVPKESIAYENGTPAVVEMSITSNQSGYLLQGDNWQVSLEATDTQGNSLVLDDSGNIVLNSDRFVQFQGTGFAPGSIIKVWLFSDPSSIADVVADSNGNFTGSAQLPAEIENGNHTVQLNGLSKDGQVRSVALGVVVQPDVAAAPTLIPVDVAPLWNLLFITAGVAMMLLLVLVVRRRLFLTQAKRGMRKEEKAVQKSSKALAKKQKRDAAKEQLLIDEMDPFLAKQVTEANPSQQFPNDSRRKIGAAAPPNRKRFGFKPKGA